MMKRTLLSIMATTLCIAMLFGCGGAPASSAAPASQAPAAPASAAPASQAPAAPAAPAASAEPIEVVWWTYFGNKNVEYLNALIDQYHASQKVYHVTLEQQGTQAEMNAKMQSTSLADLPEMFNGAVENIGTYAASPYTVPLQKFVSADKDGWKELDATYKGLVSAYSDGSGNLVGYPIGNSYGGIFVNMDIFKKAGIDPYTEVKSFEDVYEVSKKLVSGGYAESGIGFHPDGYYFGAMLSREGVDSFDQGNGYLGKATKCLYSEGATQTAIKSMLGTYQKLASEKLMLPYGSDANSEVIPMFASGKLPMFMGVISQYTKLYSTSKGEIDIGMLPFCTVTDNGKGTGIPAGGTGNLIANNGDEAGQLGAYDFIKFLSSAEANAQFATKTGYLPAHSLAAETKLYQDFVKSTFPRVTACLEAQQTGDDSARLPYVGIGNEYKAANKLAISQVCGEATYSIDQAIADATASLNEAIELYNLANK